LLGALIALIALGASPLVAQAPRTFAGACTRADELDLQTVHPAPDSAPVFVGPAPRTPRFALRDGYRGRVLVAVIVDSLGRAEHEGAAIVGATDQGLRDWACDFVRQMRFAPARHAGGTVRAQAVVPFEFSARVVRRR
jgi:TonB family protein